MGPLPGQPAPAEQVADPGRLARGEQSRSRTRGVEAVEGCEQRDPGTACQVEGIEAVHAEVSVDEAYAGCADRAQQGAAPGAEGVGKAAHPARGPDTGRVAVDTSKGEPVGLLSSQEVDLEPLHESRLLEDEGLGQGEQGVAKDADRCGHGYPYFRYIGESAVDRPTGRPFSFHRYILDVCGPMSF